MSALLEAQEPSAQHLESVHPPLVHQFELLANAPGGVARLREVILTLAIQGKLVPQNSSDEPALQLLETIAAEKDRQIVSRRIKPDKPLAAPLDQCPFEIPETWAWVPMGEVVEIVRGITFPASEKTKEAAPGRIACLRTANIQEAIEWDDLLFVGRSFMGRDDQLLRPHDIVMSMANSRELVGKVALVDQIPHPESTFGGFLGVVRPWRIDPRYAMALLRSSYARSSLVDSASQTTNIANISLGKLRPLPFPLPPLPEQARIVARVDELMRLCDALEAKGRLEAEQHARLLSTLLGTLTDSSTPEELAANWQRVADHFDLLLDRPEAVDALEQVILQLGLRGVLLPSPSLDGFPTADGLQRSLHDDLFAWPTAKFGDVLTDLRYGTSAKCSYAQSGTPVLRIPNLHDGAIDTSDLKFGDLEPKEADNLRLEVGDLLIIRSNGSVGLVGTAALVSSPLPGFAFAGYLVRARLDRAKVVPSFMALVMKSPEVRRQIEGPIRTTSGVKNINSTEIQRISFTLPPLEVQDLIVQTVTELRRLCANLRKRLDRCNAVQAALADALIDQALVA